MLSRKLVLTFVLVLALALILVTPVLAQDETPPGPESMTLTAILLWVIAGPGAAYLVGKFVTEVLENISGWHNLPSYLKVIIPIGIAGILPALAQLLLSWDGLGVVEPWVNLMIGSIVLWLSGQSSYRNLKAKHPDYGLRPGG